RPPAVLSPLSLHDALPIFERPGDALEGDVGGGALHLGVGGEHLAFADRLELAVKALVDGEAAEIRRAGDLGVGFLGYHLHLERSGRAVAHGQSPESPVSRASASADL